MFKNIVINRSNLAGSTITLSSVREAEDSEGQKFNYYWLTFHTEEGDLICCTGQKFTTLLGKDADDAKAAEVIKTNEGKFQITQAEDEEGPIYVNDDPDRPLLKISAVAHSVALW